MASERIIKPLNLAALALCHEAYIRGKRPRTRFAYQSYFEWYCKWDNGASSAPSALLALLSGGKLLADKKLYDYREHLLRERHPVSQVRNAIIPLTGFCKTARLDGLIDWDLKSVIPPLPRKLGGEQKVPDLQSVTYEQLAALRAHIAKDQSPTGLRDQAMLSVISEALLSTVETVSLKVCDVDLAHSRLRIWNRGAHRDDYLPLSRCTLREIESWIRCRPRSQSDRLFVSTSPNYDRPGGQRALTERILLKVVARRCLDARIPHITPKMIKLLGINEVALLCTQKGYSVPAGMAITRQTSDRLFRLHSHAANEAAKSALSDALSKRSRGGNAK
ncbi:MAG: hypothetical protein IPP19_03880 [Verrucomicrobia bacterium]|nr:hypothetical protein [Verrucomicrobiota bacterium]